LHALRPENVTGLLHDKYRRLLGLLSGLDDAGKIAACEMLGLYARENFAGPLSPSPDFTALGDALELEISSACSAAVLAAALKTRMAIGGKLPTEVIARAMSFWGYSEEVTASFLRALIPYAADLKPIFRSFFIFSSESAEVKGEKLKILAGVLDEDNCSEILRELQTYLRTQSANPQVTGLAVGLATRIAEKFPRHLLPVMRGFFALLDASDENLSSEVVGK
jgi:Adaptin N terminal region